MISEKGCNSCKVHRTIKKQCQKTLASGLMTMIEDSQEQMEDVDQKNPEKIRGRSGAGRIDQSFASRRRRSR